MATIRNRNNKWQARVRKHGFAPVEKSFLTKQDAEKWARAIEREQDIGSYVCRNSIEQTTLKELIQHYKDEVAPLLRGSIPETYRLTTISNSQIGKLSLIALTPITIAGYRDHRLKSVSNSTVLRELQSLSAMLNHARMEWGYVRFDRLGPHAAQLQALEQALIVARKWLWVFVCHHHSPHGKVQKILCGAEENYGFESNRWGAFLRDSGFVQHCAPRGAAR